MDDVVVIENAYTKEGRAKVKLLQPGGQEGAGGGDCRGGPESGDHPAGNRHPAHLDGLLHALPLADWMQVTVIPLAPHPNDPDSERASA